jgi:hypothetical protein
VCVALLLATLAGCGGEQAAEQRQAAERSAMADAANTARRAAATPSTGLWTEEHLLDRLVRAGVAPRKAPEPRALAPWMTKEPLVILAGGGEVFAWIFADSAARRAVTDALDPATGTPRGQTVPFPPPMRFITQNNLAAVISGGTETNHERIALALQAGLPVTTPVPPETP